MAKPKKLLRVLLLCPSPEKNGGVAFYYSLFRKYFTSNNVAIDYLYVGSDITGIKIKALIKVLKDIIKLIQISKNFDIVVLNPSLSFKSLSRDGVFLFISKRIYRKRTIVFFRGWNINTQNFIEKSLLPIFKKIYCFDKALVLSNNIKNTLITWGYNKHDIILETTTYEKSNFLPDNIIYNLVFLSRFVKKKGGLETIQTVELLIDIYPKLKLYMIGRGEEESSLREYVQRKKLENHVVFPGWLVGEEKCKILAQCGVMIFPTNYGEGMPNCILEGMGMGLVVLSRPVAGISDVIGQGKNGFLVHSMNPADFADKLKYLFDNPKEWKRMSEFNRSTSERKYEISNVVKRMEALYLNVGNRQEMVE